MKRSAPLLACLLILTACAQRWVGTGVVVEKRHEASHVTYTQQCNWNGDSMTCSQSPIVHPERWLLVVQDETGKQHNIVVRAATFRQCEVGNNYTTGYRHCDLR